MQIGALEPYERALAGESGGALALVTEAGRRFDLAVSRYLAAADATDRTVLDRCVGSVLDLGCGPGRMVRAVHELGRPVLGIDIARGAVDLARRTGLPVLRRDVFEPLPGEGSWGTALLLDGNVGIGGDPVALLARVAELIAADGRVVVEASSDGAVDIAPGNVRFWTGGAATGPPFGWAFVAADDLADLATATGYDVEDSWSAGGRRFVSLAKSRATRTA